MFLQFGARVNVHDIYKVQPIHFLFWWQWGSPDTLIIWYKDDQTCSTGAERLKVITSTIEDDRVDPFSLLEDSDVEEAALVVDSDDETDDLLDLM